MGTVKKLLKISEINKHAVLKEFGITLEEFEDLVKKIHDFIDQSVHLPKEYDSAMVIGSIINNKANLKAAEVFVENYFRIKNVYSELLFKDCTPTSKWFKEATKATINVTTSKLTPDNHRVQFFKYTDPEGLVENMFSYLITLIMVCEIRGHCDYASSSVIVVDMEQLTYKTVMKHSMQYVMIVKDIMQSIHLRITGMHYVNGPPLLDKFLTIIKSALPEKIKNRVYIHKDFESLQQFVPKECLPKDYGGTDKSLQELHEEWVEALIELQPFFEKLRTAKSTKKYEFDEAATKNLGLGVEGTFKKLNID